MTRGQSGPPGGANVRSVPVATLRRDGGTQPRAGLTEAIVADYSEAMETGATFPPVLVFFDGTAYWLADGFHRAAAAERCQRIQLEADVRQGSRRDACLAAAGANATHGLRRSNADKRRAVALLLADDEWGRWSDRKVARICGVSATFVGTLRGELSIHGGQMDGARRLVERGGVVYEMDTAGIGPMSEAERSRFEQLNATIARGREAAGQGIREMEALGIRLTSTGVSFPPGLPFEDWRRVGGLLANLHMLAGLSASSEKEAQVVDPTHWTPDTIVLDPEIRDLLPACTARDDSELDEHIRLHGVVEPLVIWPGPRILVDGYRRLAVIVRHHLPYRVALIEFASRDEAVTYRLREQYLRLGLSAGDRAPYGRDLAGSNSPR